MKAKLAPLMSSAKTTWRTPEIVLERVRRVNYIDLDPCGGVGSIVFANETFCGQQEKDGLTESWTKYLEDDGKGLVFVNPPYGVSALNEWIGKCADEAYRGAEIIALIPARTDRICWHKYIVHAQAVCFWAGRLTFLEAENCAPFPSALVYWGRQANKFKEAFKDVGWVITNNAGYGRF